MSKETVLEFQRRASLTWRRTRIWIALCVPAAIGLYWSQRAVELGSDRQQWLAIGCFAYIALAIIVCTFVARRHYRCPECEEFVADSDGGIPLFPRACRNCGARLR
jgi:hypothetical protein